MPPFEPPAISKVVKSARRLRSQHIQEGARAIAKKHGHARSGGYSSVFADIEPTQANAERIIRQVMNDPKNVVRGESVFDVYGHAGRGVRFSPKSGKFVGFLEDHLRSP